MTTKSFCSTTFAVMSFHFHLCFGSQEYVTREESKVHSTSKESEDQRLRNNHISSR